MVDWGFQTAVGAAGVSKKPAFLHIFLIVQNSNLKN